jgi:hypothetical protein
VQVAGVVQDKEVLLLQVRLSHPFIATMVALDCNMISQDQMYFMQAAVLGVCTLAT